MNLGCRSSARLRDCEAAPFRMTEEDEGCVDVVNLAGEVGPYLLPWLGAVEEELRRRSFVEEALWLKLC